jgi:hypothetical protein
MSDTPTEPTTPAASGVRSAPAPRAAANLTDVGALLACVDELLTPKKRWTKEVYARSAQRTPTAARAPDAVKFCLVGAVYHCSEDAQARHTACRLLARAINEHLPPHGATADNLTMFNDAGTTTHADVVAVVRRARTYAK